jgi:CRISPR-associated protein Cas1
MPPKDPVNSLLSFGYTLLLYEIYTAIVNKGLHPYAAFLHKDRKGHPSLASDLIEEWRAVIVDSLVLKLFRKGSFIRDDFITKEKTGGVYLCRNKVKKFISEFETKLNTEVRYASISGSRMSFRRTIAYQANSLAKAIDSENPTLYYPIKVR